MGEWGSVFEGSDGTEDRAGEREEELECVCACERERKTGVEPKGMDLEMCSLYVTSSHFPHPSFLKRERETEREEM